MAIISSEIVYRLSGGAGNAAANASLGGAISANAMPVNLFDDVSSTESDAGDTEYRCIYVRNSNATLTLQSAVLWFSANTVENRLSAGLGSSGMNGLEQAVPNESTGPVGVAFSQPSSRETGIALGNIPAGQHRAVWLRRIVAPGTLAVNDAATLRVSGETAA